MLVSPCNNRVEDTAAKKRVAVIDQRSNRMIRLRSLHHRTFKISDINCGLEKGSNNRKLDRSHCCTSSIARRLSSLHLDSTPLRTETGQGVDSSLWLAATPPGKQYRVLTRAPFRAVADQSRFHTSHSCRTCLPAFGRGLKQSRHDFVKGILLKRLLKNPILLSISNLDLNLNCIHQRFSALPKSPLDGTSGIFQVVEPPNSSLRVPPHRAAIQLRKDGRIRCAPLCKNFHF